MPSDTQTIPKIRRVIYDTYANFPASGLSVGDLAFATDRLVLYRWDGAAWDELTIYISSGVAANIPSAANLPEGSLYYETDTLLLKQIQSAAWVIITSGTQWGYVLKSADETVNNSDTFQNDDELLLSMAANEVYLVILLAIARAANATPDIKFQWTAPAGAYITFLNAGINAAGVDDISEVRLTDPEDYQVNITYDLISFTHIGIAINGGTAGNLQLQWAQNVAHASNTTVKANSMILYLKLA